VFGRPREETAMSVAYPSDVEILTRFVAIVAQSLRIDPARVTPDASLSALGAESLDLLEITMEAEEQFNIVIPQKSILQTAQQVFGERVLVANGVLTGAGRQLLQARLPGIDLSSFGPTLTIADVGTLFLRVDIWVQLIQRLIERSPRRCPDCGSDFPTAVASRLKCDRCGVERDLPSGDDLNREWVEEYHRLWLAENAGSAQTV
jgi:acyl carrier protein